MQNKEKAISTPIQASVRIAVLPLQRYVLARGTVNASAIRALGTFSAAVFYLFSHRGLLPKEQTSSSLFPSISYSQYILLIGNCSE